MKELLSQKLRCDAEEKKSARGAYSFFLFTLLFFFLYIYQHKRKKTKKKESQIKLVKVSPYFLGSHDTLHSLNKT